MFFNFYYTGLLDKKVRGKMKAKRYKNNNSKRKKWIKFIPILCIIIMIFVGIGLVKKNIKVKDQPENSNVTKTNGISNENTVTENEIAEEKKEQVIQIGGYMVIGKIRIPKIGLEDVILEKTTEDSLNLGLTKFWGPEMNEIGNFSITGHNYKIDRSKLFSELDNVVVEDTFLLEDNKGREVTYKVYKKYTVNPKDTSSIDQNEDGKREVTLITCTKGAKERIIIKAREI